MSSSAMRLALQHSRANTLSLLRLSNNTHTQTHASVVIRRALLKWLWNCPLHTRRSRAPRWNALSVLLGRNPAGVREVALERMANAVTHASKKSGTEIVFCFFAGPPVESGQATSDATRDIPRRVDKPRRRRAGERGAERDGDDDDEGAHKLLQRNGFFSGRTSFAFTLLLIPPK